MSININEEGFQRRLDAVHDVLRLYGLEWTAVDTVEYVDYFPFPFNNFIYKISLSTPATPNVFASKPRRPGTTLPSASGTSTLILRLSNYQADGLNNANRVDNEVAALHLVRAHFVDSHPDLVSILPTVYAWAPCGEPDASGDVKESEFGWTLTEYLPGTGLDKEFQGMDMSGKLAVVEQVATIFAALQGTPVPSALLASKHIGGLRFDDEGNVVGGEMPILPGGPWIDYASMWVARMRMQLINADKSPIVQGWKVDGVRERINRFLDGGVAQLLDGVDMDMRAIIHGDFTMNNMLFDSNTQRVTGLLDFDWACVTHPVHEFNTSFSDLGGGTNPADEKLQEAVLSGDFGTQVSFTDGASEEHVQNWKIAEAWDAALKAYGALRPSSIVGIRKLERLRALETMICPWNLGNLVQIKRATPEKLEAARKDAETTLIAELEAFGY